MSSLASHRSRAAAAAFAIFAFLGAGCSTIVARIGPGQLTEEAFLEQVGTGEYDAAYAMLCPAVRTGLPATAFQDAMEENLYLRSATGVAIRKRSVFGGQAITDDVVLASTAGTTEAQFHFSNPPSGWCVTGIVVGGTPALPAPGSHAARVAAGSPEGLPADRLPAALRHDGARYLGLLHRGVRRFVYSTGSGSEGGPGQQQAVIRDVSAERAMVRLRRGGSLAVLGSQDISIRPDGVWLERTTSGSLAAPVLLAPATLTPGVTWESRYDMTDATGVVTRFRGHSRVEGRERSTTPAGVFETLHIVTRASIDAGDAHSDQTLEDWRDRELGLVRLSASGAESNGGTFSSEIVLTGVD